MRGVKIWHPSMCSDPAVALSFQTGSIPKSIFLLWVWSEKFAILSWVWIWSTGETGMRRDKIWHHSMFSDLAVALLYRTGSIPRSICLIWVWSEIFAILVEFEFDWRPKPVWEESKFDIVWCSQIQLWLCHIQLVVSLVQYASYEFDRKHLQFWVEFEFDQRPKPVWEEFKFDIVRCSQIQLWLCYIELVVSLCRYAWYEFDWERLQFWVEFEFDQHPKPVWE